MMTKFEKMCVERSSGKKSRRSTVSSELFIGTTPASVRLVTPDEIDAIQNHFQQEIQDLLNFRHPHDEEKLCDQKKIFGEVK